MWSPLQVELDACRYALAVQALKDARRAWHELDAALVDARTGDGAPAALPAPLDAAGRALAALDRELANLVTLLDAAGDLDGMQRDDTHSPR